MANVTEKDIVEYLEKKMNFYYNEVKRIKDILSAINDNYTDFSNHSFDGLPTFVYPGDFAKKKPRKQRDTIKILEIPEYYRPQLSFSSKIAFVLNKIQTGIKEEIAEQIILLQPELDINQVTKNLSTVLSELKSKNLLTTIKIGRKYRYGLPKNNLDIINNEYQ